MLLKLNAHGPHFAVLFKRCIAEFCFVLIGEKWVTVCRSKLQPDLYVLFPRFSERFMFSHRVKGNISEPLPVQLVQLSPHSPRLFSPLYILYI